METLIAPGSCDEMGALLGALRVRSTLFCRSDMRAPWGFRVHAHGQLAFHALLEGRARLDIDGLEAPVELGAGDVILLRGGPEHQLRSGPDARIEWLDDILDRRPLRKGQLRYGGRGARTDLICGVIELEGPSARRLMSLLPPASVVRADEARSWLPPLVDLVQAEVGAFEPGADSVAARLADILLLQVVRQSLRLGGAAAVPDRYVSRAIRLLLDDPARGWTTEGLARAAATSRSALVSKFRRVTGDPPMRYLARHRTTLARNYLTNTDASLAEIADAVGYGTVASLSKAFRREVGMSPGAFRAAAQAEIRPVPARRPSRSTAA